MTAKPLKNDPIIIVGAGVFGLSTALHLAQRGYKQVTVLDRQNYDHSDYSYVKGCDAASADINKVVRTAYGQETVYSELSFEVLDSWKAWNDEIAEGNTPPGMTSDDVVFKHTGLLSVNEGSQIPPFELATVKALEEAGHVGIHLLSTDEKHVKLSTERGFKMDPWKAKSRGQQIVSLLDSAGGIAIADKACRFALHKARALGANFLFGSRQGVLDSILYDDNGRANGVRTKDDKEHPAKLVIVACGSWTPTLIPELDGLCETTGGSVAVYRIPKTSGLFERLAPENFPAFNFNMRHGPSGGLYGFPRNDQGYFKIGYRGTKYTNPKLQSDGKERSSPVTRYTEGEKITVVPDQAMQVMSRFIQDYLPEINDEGIKVEFTRMCWYNDTIDNHFLIDRVPGKAGLMVATGGSGHAFMYLPILGKWIADIIEERGLDRPAIQAWRWRQPANTASVNTLMEGSGSPRALQNVAISSAEEIPFFARSRL